MVRPSLPGGSPRPRVLAVDACPYCLATLGGDTAGDKTHLKIHKALRHKPLPCQFRVFSLASSQLPAVLGQFRRY